MEGGREDVNSFTMGIFSFELNSRVSGFFFFLTLLFLSQI